MVFPWSIPQKKKHINPLKFGFSTAPGVGNHRSGAVGHPLRHCAGSCLQRGPGEFATAQQTPGEAELEELVVQHPEEPAIASIQKRLSFQKCRFLYILYVYIYIYYLKKNVETYIHV